MRLRSTSIRTKLLGTVLALGSAANGAWAHEFWLEPRTHRPEVGTVLSVDTYVGHAVLPELLPRDTNLLESFRLHCGDQETPLVGRAGGTPAGMVRAPSEGTAWVSYVSRPTLLTMESDRFEAYLAEEGLEFISERRALRGDGAGEVDEAFSRCAKALLALGGKSGPGFDEPLGLALELIPRVDPAGLEFRTATEAERAVPVTPKVDEVYDRRADFGLRLVFEGRPLAHARVSLSSLDRKWLTPIVGRTDGEGALGVALPCGGRWLASSVHMTEAPPELAADAQWRSLWASMVFEVAQDPALETTKAPTERPEGGAPQGPR